MKDKKRDVDIYYVDCINACHGNPDDAKDAGGDWVFCPECGEHGIIYDLRDSLEK